MTSGTDLRAVQSEFEAHFSATGALRESIGTSGRVHLDRWLPFIFLHRGADDDDSLARRIAINSPSYGLWSESDDEAAGGALADVVAAIAEHEDKVLVVTLTDGPILPRLAGSDKLPPFEAVIGAGRHVDAARSAAALEHALAKVEIDLRYCKVDRRGFEPLLPPAIDKALNAIAGVSRLSLEVPPIHRSAGGAVFPEIRHELVMHIGDALLRTACAFIDDGKRVAPKHYRSLGRSAYLAAALKADKRLAAMSASFDFLLSISPIDTARACDEFLAGKAQEPPSFHYRPLSVDPDAAKGYLYDIDLAQLEDPLLETLLSEKRREIDAQLTMLATRNTNAFRPASMVLYGTVDAALLESAQSILALPGKNPRRGEGVGADRTAAAARELIAQYQAQDSSFLATVEVRDDVSGLMVSRDKLMIGSDSAMPANRLDALLAHEVSVHLLTYFNGASQGLGIFASGLAGYEGVQEGLGVFAEWAVGGLTRTRMRLLAARVVAVHAMQQGAEFIQCYRMLHHDHGFTPRGAFGIAARVFRSGGLAKDAIYLKGFKTVIDMLAQGRSLAPFWLGKIAPRHVPAIEELLLRGLVHEPIFTPRFLLDGGTKQRIARLRTRSHLSELLND